MNIRTSLAEEEEGKFLVWPRFICQHVRVFLDPATRGQRVLGLAALPRSRALSPQKNILIGGQPVSQLPVAVRGTAATV